MRYYVKTRNFQGKLWVKNLLDRVAYGSQDYGDHDVKYGYQTNSLVAALAVLAYFKALSRFSGGWTYIQDQTKEHNLSEYRMFYL